MSFVRVNDDGSLSPGYNFVKLRALNPGETFSREIMNDPAALAKYRVFPVVEDPPDYDPAMQRLTKTMVIKVGDDYVQQYALVSTPSFLTGGDREPSSAELDAMPEAAKTYWEWRINGYLSEGAIANEFREVLRVPAAEGHIFRVEGRINNAASYTDQSGPFQQRARAVENWRTKVWATAVTLRTAWESSRGTATPIPAPTWPELRAKLPAWPVP